ncbi:methyltransferase domain-containing protein [Candidatus Woesearchaeota archaeon]|nr:methyltransferase domain-containing protein [Candidatus Woesearchaeota archaeon]
MIIEQLKKLEQESIERKVPIIGSEKGRWILDKIKQLKPKTILELGTANGYSGIILASEGAILTTVDTSPHAVQEAMKNFKEFNVTAHVILGDGVKYVEELAQENIRFDMILLDFANKEYINVLENCIKILSKDGVLVADNIDLPGCYEFKEKIQVHPKLNTEMIKIGNGMSYSILK